MKLQETLLQVGHEYREVASLSELRERSRQDSSTSSSPISAMPPSSNRAWVRLPRRARSGGLQADQGGNPRGGKTTPILDSRTRPGGPVPDDDRRGRAFREGHLAKGDVAVRCAAPSDRSRAAAVLALTSSVFPSRPRGAQSAWLPFDGEGGVSLTFQSLDYGGHFTSTERSAGPRSLARVHGLFQIRIRAHGSARVHRAPALHRLEVHGNQNEPSSCS